MENEQSLYDEIAYLNNQLSAALERNDELEFELKEAQLALENSCIHSSHFSNSAQELEDKIESLREKNNNLAGELGSVNLSLKATRKFVVSLFVLSELSFSTIIMNSFDGPWWQFIIFSLVAGFISSLFCALISGFCMMILPDRPLSDSLPPIALVPLACIIHVVGVFLLPLFASRFQF